MPNRKNESSISPIPPPNVLDAIKSLWSTDVFKAVFARANEFAIQDNADL